MLGQPGPNFGRRGADSDGLGVAYLGLRHQLIPGQGALDLATADARGLLAGPTAWVVGSEATGVPPAYAGRADASVRVPMYGQAESLNVSVATALCLYASADAHRRAGPA